MWKGCGEREGGKRKGERCLGKHRSSEKSGDMGSPPWGKKSNHFLQLGWIFLVGGFFLLWSFYEFFLLAIGPLKNCFIKVVDGFVILLKLSSLVIWNSTGSFMFGAGVIESVGRVLALHTAADSGSISGNPDGLEHFSVQNQEKAFMCPRMP